MQRVGFGHRSRSCGFRLCREKGLVIGACPVVLDFRGTKLHDIGLTKARVVEGFNTYGLWFGTSRPGAPVNGNMLDMQSYCLMRCLVGHGWGQLGYGRASRGENLAGIGRYSRKGAGVRLGCVAFMAGVCVCA
jgi:hypothetical protein